MMISIMAPIRPKDDAEPWPNKFSYSGSSTILYSSLATAVYYLNSSGEGATFKQHIDCVKTNQHK